MTITTNFPASDAIKAAIEQGESCPACGAEEGESCNRPRLDQQGCCCPIFDPRR